VLDRFFETKFSFECFELSLIFTDYNSRFLPGFLAYSLKLSSTLSLKPNSFAPSSVLWYMNQHEVISSEMSQMTSGNPDQAASFSGNCVYVLDLPIPAFPQF
jgi:hypothetical protein